MPDVGIHKKNEVDLPTLIERLRVGLDENVGAIGCFVGVVRGISDHGERVKSLFYEASEDVSKKLQEIATETEGKPNIQKVMIYHIIDDLKPGEDTIYILVAGHGRKDVFEALSGITDRVKKEAPIWKKEITEKREYWIHDTEE